MSDGERERLGKTAFLGFCKARLGRPPFPLDVDRWWAEKPEFEREGYRASAAAVAEEVRRADAERLAGPLPTLVHHKGPLREVRAAFESLILARDQYVAVADHSDEWGGAAGLAVRLKDRWDRWRDALAAAEAELAALRAVRVRADEALGSWENGDRIKDVGAAMERLSDALDAAAGAPAGGEGEGS